MFGGGNLWQIPACLLSLFYVMIKILQIWMVKFGKPLVIRQIRQGLPPPNIHTIQCIIKHKSQVEVDQVGLWKPKYMYIAVIQHNCSIFFLM